MRVLCWRNVNVYQLFTYSMTCLYSICFPWWSLQILVHQIWLLIIYSSYSFQLRGEGYWLVLKLMLAKFNISCVYNSGFPIFRRVQNWFQCCVINGVWLCRVLFEINLDRSRPLCRGWGCWCQSCLVYSFDKPSQWALSRLSLMFYWKFSALHELKIFVEKCKEAFY